MNRFLAAFAVSLTMLLPGAALAQTTFDDPIALLEYAYEPYGTGQFPEDPYELYSSNLKALIAADAARTPADEVGALDFDPFIGAQDYELADLSIGEASVVEDRATVEVDFKNMGLDQTMLFSLTKEQDGWKIDDIESTTPNNEFRLSEVLGSDPLLN